jgi:hypothetical protein
VSKGVPEHCTRCCGRIKNNRFALENVGYTVMGTSVINIISDDLG